MSEEKEETVSKKVLVGESKYREYRLPKSLVTDRSCLWRRKCEIGKRVSEILKSKNAKINEYHAKIKQLEKARDSWKTIAKSVTEDNESFFLDALSASDKDIELFENENFLASNSWSKLRKVGDLSEEERQELGVNCADSSLTADNKPDHYNWVLQKTEGPQPEPIVAKEVANSVAPVPVSATISQDHDQNGDVASDTSPVGGKDDSDNTCVPTTELKKEESLPTCEKSTSDDSSSTTVQDNNPITEDLPKHSTLNNGTGPCNGTLKEKVVEDDKSEIGGSEVQEVAETSPKKETPPSTEEVVPPAEEQKSSSSFNDNSDKSQDKTDDVTSNPLKHDDDSQEPPQTDSSESVDKPKENAVETADLKVDEVKETKTTKEPKQNEDEVVKIENDNGVAKDVEVNGHEVVEPKHEENGSKEAPKPEKAPEAPKHNLVFPTGYPRLRLTSDQSSVEESDPPLPKVANIWQLRAAEREEKMKAAKEALPSLPSNGSTAVGSAPAPTFTPKTPTWVKQPSLVIKESPVKKERAKPAYQQNVKVASQPVQNVSTAKEQKEPVKKTDANGWTMFSSKKGKRNSMDENIKAPKVIDIPKNGVGNSSSSAPSPAKTSEVEKSVTKDVKPTNEALEQSSTDLMTPEDDEVSTKNAELLEKRKLRRQRRQNKTKEQAKQAKEQEKKLKEQQRMEQEKQIEETKRKKKEEQDMKFLQKKQEMETIRKTREDAQRLKLKHCDEGFKEMLDVKNRMTEYLKSKQIPYRLIACNCYIAARVKELENENLEIDINATKLRTLLEYKAQMKNLEMKNNHMMFISVQMQEKSKEFKLDDLLSYVYHDHYQIPIEHTSPYQRKVRTAYDQFCRENKCDASENMVKAIQFAENLINKMNALENRSAPYENALLMLKEYKELHHNIFDFLGIATYLRTRMDTPFFVLEEDYLLNIQHFEDEHAERRNNGIKQAVAEKKMKPEEKSEENSQEAVKVNGEQNGDHGNEESVDDEEEEAPECVDGFCQTDENYDVRAASYLPEIPAEPVQ